MISFYNFNLRQPWPGDMPLALSVGNTQKRNRSSGDGWELELILSFWLAVE